MTMVDIDVIIVLMKRFRNGDGSSSLLMTDEFSAKWDQYIAQIKEQNIDTSQVNYHIT